MKKKVLILLSVMFLSLGTSAAFEKVNTYSGNFNDVADTSWYANDVKTAYELGFMNGKSENTFDPDGKVMISEAIAMAARLHAAYNRNEIKEKTIKESEFRFDFDENTPFVDLTARNQRLDFGVGLNKAKGGIENGMLVMTADGFNSHGSYDPGFFVSGLELDTRKYNLIKVRMKRDELPNTDPDAKRTETLEVFFETSSASSITGDKCVTYNLKNIPDLTQWFEVEIDMSKHSKYKDYLNGIRFDTTNNNGKYYIDYIVFTSNGKETQQKWYEMYVDYAVDNGIVDKNKYKTSQMGSYIKRSELCDLFAAALPVEYYNAINDIKGIPDVEYDDKNADLYLMLYKAGVLLGTDDVGTFNGDSYVKRSEISAIINRAALPESRVRGSIQADWTGNYSEFDIDFENDAFGYTLEATTGDVSNGVLVMKAVDRGENHKSRFDPRVVVKNVNIPAQDYIKMRVRMKADFAQPVESPTYDFYYMTEGDDNFSETKSLHGVCAEYFKDAAGWYIFEIDFRLDPSWTGNVTAFRFDPGNSDGTYTIDYIRFIKGNYDKNATHEELLEAGYTATRLLQDEGFETGFQVNRVKNTASSLELGYFQDYVEEKTNPLWNISPHWARFDLIDDRDESKGKYTIADKHGVNSITYNPDEKSLTMSVNTYPVYEGKPHINDEYEWWPHLLVSQASSHCPIDKKRNSADADRMFVEIDIRLLDFKDTTIQGGTMSANFMAYFYLRTDKAPGDLIWFGLNFFNGTRVDSTTRCGWAPDSAAHQYMYKMSQGIVFDGVENSFVPEKGVVLTGEEWKHVRLDVTPHIEQAVQWANRDNIFGVPVTKEDMYFEGVNIGYETWGSYEYTVEFKNFNMVSYNK